MDNINNLRLDELPSEHPLRQQPFVAPDGYFDQLPSRVQARVMRKPKPAFTISWSWQRTATSMAAASLFAVLVWQTLPQRQETLGSEALAGVSNEAIASYLDDQSIDPYALADGQQIHSSLGDDTTAVEYLNVKPADIQQHIDEQNVSELLDLGS